MKRVLFSLMFVALPTLAFAQVHPCDTTPPTAMTVDQGTSWTLGWCEPARPTDPVVASFKVYRNGVVVPATVVTDPAINAAGLRFSHLNRTDAATGTFTFEVSAVLADGREGVKSPVPFVLTVQSPLPAGPSRLQGSQP